MHQRPGGTTHHTSRCCRRNKDGKRSCSVEMIRTPLSIPWFIASPRHQDEDCDWAKHGRAAVRGPLNCTNRSLILTVNNYIQGINRIPARQEMNKWLTTTGGSRRVSMWRTRWPCWKTGLGNPKIAVTNHWVRCSWHVGLASLLEVISSNK